MKSKYFFTNCLSILLLLLPLLSLFYILFYTKSTKEGFQQNYCQRFKSCVDCSSASGCSWCPKLNICLSNTSLKSTDKECNQNNTISSSFSCSSENVNDSLMSSESNAVMYDFSLFKNRITDKIPPPNLYMAGKMKVSNEDLLSNMNDVRNDIKNSRQELPGLIASTVEDQIKPIVKGVLSENYYIQGFEDMNAETKCKTYNSCTSCVGDNSCAWNPRASRCEKRGPNNMWQIISPSKCVLSSSTIGSMMARPGGNV